MLISRGRHCWPYLAVLCALGACSSSSTSAQHPLCPTGIDNTIQVTLGAFPQALPLDVRTCVQAKPCQTTHTFGKGGVGITFTLNDHHQNFTVPVSVTVATAGRTLADGKVDVPITENFYTDETTHKTANCGGRGYIVVSANGQLKASRGS